MRLLVKLGGALLDSPESRASIAAEIAGVAESHQVVVVHGGGKQLTRFLAKQGVESRFLNGFRVTTPETLDAVVKVLAGEVNTELVTALQSAGARAVGLTGADAGLVRAVPLSEALGAVGRVEEVRPQLLEVLVSSAYLPVVACLAGGDGAAIYNVNADQMAVAVATGFRADRLIFLTDVDGVLDAARRVIPELTAAGAEELIEQGIASGGMEAKLRACAAAIRGGVAEVRIVPGAYPGVLACMLSGRQLGTTLLP